MIKTLLKNELQSLSIRRNLLQKEIGGDSNIANATLNGYFTGSKAVPIEKAVKIAQTSGDNLFTSQLAYKFLGFIQAMDGSLSSVSEAELDIFQKIESDERKSYKSLAQKLIVESKVRNLDREELRTIQTYGLEMLDEIVLELTIAYKAFEVVGLDIQDAIEQKMPEWQAKNYMRRD